MYIYIYIYAYIYIYICKCIYIYTYIHTHGLYIYIYIHIHIFVDIYIYIYLLFVYTLESALMIWSMQVRASDDGTFHEIYATKLRSSWCVKTKDICPVVKKCYLCSSDTSPNLKHSQGEGLKYFSGTALRIGHAASFQSIDLEKDRPSPWGLGTLQGHAEVKASHHSGIWAPPFEMLLFESMRTVRTGHSFVYLQFSSAMATFSCSASLAHIQFA